MNSNGKLYAFVAVLVSIGLLAQIFVVPSAQSADLPAQASSLTSNQVNLPADLAQELSGIGTLGGNGLPNGMLLDMAAIQANAQPAEPEALANPISISRVQSSYQAGGTAVVTFTVSNNRPPSIYPDIPTGATVTETAQIMAGFDITADPNAVRDVTVVDTLAGPANFLGAVPLPDRQGDNFVWNLGDIPPQSTRSFSLTLQLPGAAADFVDLDAGATAFGSLQGRMVSAQAANIVLAPDGFAQWLIWTPDANIHDKYMLDQAAALEGDPTTLFEYVRSLGYELYEGSMRGTRGTLWSASGNSADQSSLLIGMLRSHGIPARYRHGTLGTAVAQELIQSMFPTPNQVIGHIPAGATVSDPVNDPELIAEAQDHWWVEAYFPGNGWTNLDPSFATANIGDMFATPAGDGTDQIAELPDGTRHKVHLTLQVERYSDFPVSGSNLSVVYPLTTTLNSVEMVGRPANISFLVSTETQGGLTYANVIHTYTPLLSLGNSAFAIEGETFSDLLTNFPLATNFTTGIWLTVETETPDGQLNAYKREIKDRIGVEARVNGGQIQLEPLGDQPAISTADAIQLQVFPQSRTPRIEVDAALGDVLAVSAGIGETHATFANLDSTDPVAAVAWINDNAGSMQASQSAMLNMVGTTFYAAATAQERVTSSEAMLVKSYPDAPKLLLMSQSSITETVDFSFELLSMRERSLAYPGQVEEAATASNLTRTMGDKAIEYELLENLRFERTQSAYGTFLAAQDNGLPLVFVTYSNLGDLEPLTISDEAKARITLAIQGGSSVIVPAEPVTVDGQPAIGWLEVDESGHASFVNEQGQRAGLLEYAIKLHTLFFATGHGAAFLGGFILVLVYFIGNVIGLAASFHEFAAGQALGESGGKVRIDLWVALAQAIASASGACSGSGAFVGDCLGGVALGGLFITMYIVGTAVSGDPSLPLMLLDLERSEGGLQSASATVVVPASSSATNLTVSAESGHLTLFGPAELGWTDSYQHGFVLSTLTANNVSLFDGPILLESGALAVGDETVVSLEGSNVVVDLTADGSYSFFAPAVSGLGLGTNWTSYSADLSSGQPYTITLVDATVTMNSSNTYTGTLTAVVTGAAQVSGADHSPVPEFSIGTTSQVLAAGLNIGPLSGTVLAGGTPFPAANGIAVAPFTGPVTVNESSASTDLVQFNGPADFFSLSLNPSSSSINPTQAVTITPVLEANFSDSYSMTIEAPAGWVATIADTGEMTAQPPAGAAPADYSLLMTARSGQHPDLFASAIHTVTTVAHEGLALTIEEEPLITVPMGQLSDPSAEIPGPLGHVVNGRAEIPGAAYNIVLTNQSTISHTFDLAVSGLPAGWTILSNAGQATATSLALEAGEKGVVGLYISPTVASLMTAGTSYTIDVTAIAQGNPGLTDNASILFTMPGLSFPYPQLSPTRQFVTAGDELLLDFAVTNAGNVAGSFPVTATVHASAYSGVSISPSPVTSGETWTTPSLAPGATDNQTITITTAGMVPGQTFFVHAKSAGGEFHPTAYASFTIASASAGPVFATSNEMANACTLGEPGLSAALESLALTMTALDQSCAGGSCSLPDRDQVVTALGGVAYYAGAISSQVTADDMLQAIAADMSGHTSEIDLLADLDAIAAAMNDLATEVCELSRYLPDVSWTPHYDAILAGDTLTYTLAIENRGSLTATYAITVELPSATSSFDTTLSPGQVQTVDYPLSESTLGLYHLAAEGVFSGTATIIRAADSAQLNVVDKFIQVTAVTADPPFVESGTSSTTLSVDVVNVANLARPATARTSILAPGGGISYTADIPLTILAGSPASYEMATVDSSGWAEGVYTITVDLLDGSNNLIPDGSGFGNFAVGQGLGVSHAIQPGLVAPGSVTVTTVITSEVLLSVIPSDTLETGLRPEWQATGLRPKITVTVAPETGTVDPVTLDLAEYSEPVAVDRPGASESGGVPLVVGPDTTQGTEIVRYEEDELGITYTGSWTTVADNQASNSSYTRASSAASASFGFSGSWIGVGFLGSSSSGRAEIYIDGISQGTVDLYRRDEEAVSFYFDGLISTTHSISVTVLGTSNPNASNSYVRLDFFDTWSGNSLADGTFEHDDPRLFLSGGWSTVSNGTASNGTYGRASSATAWFPFTGDTVSYQALAYSGGGKVKVYIDGQFQTFFDLYSLATMTRTLSFESLGAGPHLMQVSSYRGNATIDTFATPGSAPYYTPTVPTGIVRYEEDDPTILYNGAIYTQTATSWTAVNSSRASDGYYLRSNTTGDTAALTFGGTWVGVGFAAGRNSGIAEIFIDGITQGTIDLYRFFDQPVSIYYDSLISATHTISVVVTGNQHPNAGNDRVNIDFFDVWDGSMLPDGTFEAELGNNERLFLSTGWSNVANAAASDGAYLRGTATLAWFPFTGETVSYQALAYSGAGQVKVYIDGQFQTVLDLYSPVAISRTLSFEDLGAGPHVLQVGDYRGNATIDTFSTPGSAPYFLPPAPTGIIRYEEDNPAILYNGFPLTQTAASWSEVTYGPASDGYFLRSNNTGDTAELTFNGTWVGVGFAAGQSSGIVQIYIDGASQGVIDLYRHEDQAVSIYYDSLISATHTISVVVTGSQHPNANSDRVNFDFFDVWDGSTLPDGTFEAELGNDERLFLGTSWSSVNNGAASDGAYLRTSAGNAWFPFTGDTVSYQALAYTGAGKVKVYIDGQFQTILNLYAPESISRTLSFENLGTGPHVLQVSSYRSNATIDAFRTPGTPPYFSPPVPTGVIRYEEDAPTLRYNGNPLTQTATSWTEIAAVQASQGYAYRSNTLSDTVSLTFDGSWVSLGLLTATGGGLARIMIDGVVVDTADTYSPANDVLAYYYSGLITGTHTISVAVLDQSNPNAVNSYVNIDYFDYWDGAMMTDGWFEADPSYLEDGRVDMSTDWSDTSNNSARGGLYFEDGSNAWFRFTGDTVTFLAMTDVFATASAEFFIDGVSQGVLDLQYDFTNSPLPFHFTGLGTGPHVAHVKGLDRATIDAFEANPTAFHPGVPMVEWFDTNPGGGGGVISTAAAGDVDGDGQVEIAVSSGNGNLYLFSGDGGSGTPLIWSQAVGGEPDAPVLADLDGNPGSEIVVGTTAGIYAFHSDGSQYWFTDTVKTEFPAGGASAGNLDDDGEPELVVAGNTTLAVFEADGRLAWEYTHNSNLSPPVLADLTGDGFLDILVMQESSSSIYLIDYNQGISPAIAWTYTFSTSLIGLRGAPAVADIDGQQPGGDSGPEIIAASNGYVNVLNPDGSLLWATAIGAGVPGGISISDTDGDGEMEIITSAQYNGGRIYVLNADGSILWDGPALDNTSGTSAVTHDLDGDGRWEVIWNGDDMGLTIYDGTDGTILFNEPIINSVTRKDFPIVVDADGDGHGEIVAGDPTGIYIVGYDTIWADSRDLWNQYNYHMTNVNDDLTIPPVEPNSWQVHNTYRTQTPLSDVLAVYSVDITHTVGLSGVAVLTDTLPIPNDIAEPDYHWAYTQYWYQLLQTSGFDLLVSDLRPGEVRPVSQETTFVYTLPSGSNRLTLPPLYVTADHIIEVAPALLTTGPGGMAVYDVILNNPAAASDTYSLTLTGLPAEWLTMPVTVPMAAGAQVTVPLTVTVPANAAVGALGFVVTAANSSGATDLAAAALDIVDLLEVAIAPAERSTLTGIAVTYTLTLSNLDSTAHTYSLATSGLANVTIPPTVTVGATGSASIPIFVSSDTTGPNPFTITVSDSSTAGSDSAVLQVAGSRRVGLALNPTIQLGGPGTPTVFTATVTNLGDAADSYVLSATLPAGWSASLAANGVPANSVNLEANLFNSADLQLQVTPPIGTIPGNYDFSLMAQSQTNPGVTTAVTGTVQVADWGVQIAIDPVNSTLAPTDTGLWQVTITNTGSVADSYWLTSTGIVALSGQFATNPVALNAGQATQVQLTANIFDFALATTYPFAVGAESQGDSSISNEDQGTVSFTSAEAVEVAWIPVVQTITDTLTADYLMVVTNTGNIATNYDFSLNAPGLIGHLSSSQLNILPHMAAWVLVTVEASGPGIFPIEGTAASTSSPATGSSTATLEVVFTNLPPSVDAGGDQVADEGELVQFSGAATDPEGGPLEVLWEFGDGATASGTLSPTHTYLDNGQFIVTLTVTDVSGLSANDILTMTVDNFAPTVAAGTNQTTDEGSTVNLDPATFVDPGSDDTHTATIDWGDGTVEAGTVDQAANTVSGSHIYEDDGSFIVTVTVTDDDGGVGSDSFNVTVDNVAPTVEAGVDQNVAEGETVSLDPATFGDPGAADTHTATIDWGDGTVEPGAVDQVAGTVSGSHIFSTAGIYTVTITVIDDDGGQDSDTFTVIATGSEYIMFVPVVINRP